MVADIGYGNTVDLATRLGDCRVFLGPELLRTAGFHSSYPMRTSLTLSAAFLGGLARIRVHLDVAGVLGEGGDQRTCHNRLNNRMTCQYIYMKFPNGCSLF